MSDDKKTIRKEEGLKPMHFPVSGLFKMKGSIMKKRFLPLLLTLAMVVGLMPYSVFSASGNTWQDGTYEAASTKGWGGSTSPVKMSVTIREGKITELSSPEHAGESFWTVQNVDDLLQRIVNMDNNIEAVLKGLKPEGDIDVATGASYSSAAVIDATQKAVEEARVKDSEDSGPVYHAKMSFVNMSFAAYASPVVYDNTFANPDLSYRVDDNGDYVFDLILQPAKDIQLSQWYSQTWDLNGQDFTGIQYYTPGYQSKDMKLVDDNAEEGTRTFRFTLPAGEISELTQQAIQLTFQLTSEKQLEVGWAFPSTVYMSIDLDVDEPPVETDYVLMNIPYDKFYEAEGAKNVDSVTAATKKAYNHELVAGSYHDSEDLSYTRTDILGVSYPVFVEDKAVLDGMKEVESEEDLFNAADYAYFPLTEKPSSYKKLEKENDQYVFSSVSGSAIELQDVKTSVTAITKRGDYEITLSGENTEDLSGGIVYGVILTTADDSKFALRHLENIWQGVELAVCTGHTDTIKDGALTPNSEMYQALEGAELKEIRYFAKDPEGEYKVYTIVTEAQIPEYPAAGFENNKKVKLSNLTDEDLQKIMVNEESGESKYYSVKVYAGDSVLAEKAPIRQDGTVELTESAVSGTEYTVDIVQTNTKKEEDTVFASMTAVYTKQPSGGSGGSGSGGGAIVTPSYRVLTPSGTVNGKVETDLSKAKKGDTVTITVIPEEGYQPDEVVVKDKDGNPVEVKDNGDGTYSFTMPASEVSIETTFKKKNDEPEPTPPDTHENCPSEPFKDVDTSLWYHEGIDYVLEKGMMKGVSDDAFAPDETTTRAMIVTILYRLEGEPAAEAASFRDVEAGSWYEAAVNWAAANGIVNGYDADTFAPTDEITREQIAAILYRYAGFKGKDVSGKADLRSFTDSSTVSEWASDAMAWAVNTELIKGMTETTLVPQGNATRAQVATLMMRLCGNELK